jgi:glycosyltransferase involved in cell wall biosynthesis
MKIGMNALFYQNSANGSGQYLIHLLNALAQIDTRNEYILLGPRPLPKGTRTLFNYQEHPVPGLATKSKQIEKVTWEQLTAPAAARKAGVDLLHIPYFAPPLLSRIPTVVTIHDVIPLRLPAYHPNGKIKAYFNLVSRTARQATQVITVSHHAKKDIVETLKLAPERIRVIHLAAGDEYQPIHDPALRATVRARYGVGKRYIFYLGGLDQRKNVPQLVRAFAQLYAQQDDPNLQLFISGDPDKTRGPLFPDPRPIAAELGIERQIVYGFVSDEDKPVIYSDASLFVFPSLYEGFGLPPLEALACGAPVVCSNRSSLPEVVGDAALIVDPDNTTELTTAMKRVLTDKNLEADLRARALKRAAQFSWQKTAAETLAVYEEVYSKQRK